jgi:ABC-type cobalamin transport system permease subunit
MSKLTLAMISLTTILATSSAWAGAITSQPVPEPGIFGIIAAGAAAVILAARLKNKK